MRQGRLDPNRFAFLLGLQKAAAPDLGGVGVSKCTLGSRESNLLGERYSPERAARIDSTRLAYGLCTMADYYRKAVFAIRSDERTSFSFNAYEHLNTFQMDEDEHFERFVKASIEIE